MWSAGEKPQWSGPFATIETACLSIGRRLAIEIADRHTQSIERHGLTPDDLLYGLKPTTRLDVSTAGLPAAEFSQGVLPGYTSLSKAPSSLLDLKLSAARGRLRRLIALSQVDLNVVF